MGAVYFLTIYYPLHELVLKMSGASGYQLFFLRQWPDLAIVFTFIAVAFARATSSGLVVQKDGLTVRIVLFFVWAVAIVVVTGNNNLGTAFAEIFVVLRYTLLMAIVVLLRPSHRQYQKIIKLMVFSIALQTAIAWLQYFGGATVIDLFKPADYASFVTNVERSFTSNREGAARVLIGSAGDFISLSYVVSIGIFTIFASHLVGKKKRLMFVLLFVLLFLAGSRTIFLGASATIVLFGLKTKKLSRKVAYGFLTISVIVPLVVFLNSMAKQNIFEYGSFLSIFDSRILESLLNQRLGVGVFVIPEYILSGDFLVGLSPDKFYIADVIIRDYEGVPWMVQTLFPKIIEDVYILALFMYYGIIGIFLLVGIIRALYQVCNKVYLKVDRQIGALGIMCVFALVIFSFGNQAIENRMFSFYFWLIMGLNVSMLNAHQEKNAHPPHS